jgi:6-phosphofructokinase 2
MLEQLIHKEAIAFEAVVQSWTESFVAVDDNTNSQYRFVLRVV